MRFPAHCSCSVGWAVCWRGTESASNLELRLGQVNCNQCTKRRLIFLALAAFWCKRLFEALLFVAMLFVGQARFSGVMACRLVPKYHLVILVFFNVAHTGQTTLRVH